MKTPYYIYVLRCEDNSLYTGITTDVRRRFEEHCGKRTGRAKYTRLHPPVRIECVWGAADRASASRLEYRLKTLSKQQKEQLINSPHELHLFLGEKLDTTDYFVVE